MWSALVWSSMIRTDGSGQHEEPYVWQAAPHVTRAGQKSHQCTVASIRSSTIFFNFILSLLYIYMCVYIVFYCKKFIVKKFVQRYWYYFILFSWI